MHTRARPDWFTIFYYSLVVSAFALAMVIVFGNKGLIERRILMKNRMAIQRDIEKAKEENAFLDGEIQAIRKDPVAVERLARERLSMGRSNEVLFQLVPPRSARD